MVASKKTSEIVVIVVYDYCLWIIHRKKLFKICHPSPRSGHRNMSSFKVKSTCTNCHHIRLQPNLSTTQLSQNVLHINLAQSNSFNNVVRPSVSLCRISGLQIFILVQVFYCMKEFLERRGLEEVQNMMTSYLKGPEWALTFILFSLIIFGVLLKKI